MLQKDYIVINSCLEYNPHVFECCNGENATLFSLNSCLVAFVTNSHKAEKDACIRSRKCLSESRKEPGRGKATNYLDLLITSEQTQKLVVWSVRSKLTASLA